MVALFLGRFQPFHLGHLSVIEEISKDPLIDKIIIAVGSAQYFDTEDNPYHFASRKRMIIESLAIKIPYQIIGIDDINKNGWVEYVLKSIPKFDVLYTGNKIMAEKFREKGIKVVDVIKRIDISATDIRVKIRINGDWQKFVPAGTESVLSGKI